MFCAGVSFIAAAPLISIIVSTIIGTITILPAYQAIESYSVIRNSNKVTSGFHAIKETLTGEESELFIKKVLNYLCDFLVKKKKVVHKDNELSQGGKFADQFFFFGSDTVLIFP